VNTFGVMLSLSLSHSWQGPLQRPRTTSSDSISPHDSRQTMVAFPNLVQLLLIASEDNWDDASTVCQAVD